MGIKADRVDSILCSNCGAVMDVASVEPFTPAECPSCHTPQKVPMQFGGLLLLEPMGSGGMGAIYRALDPMLDRYVAVKVMKETTAGDEQFVENFFREARAAAALNHPSIVQIYSCGREYGQPYIVMELLNGGTLEDLIRDQKTVDELRVLQIGISAAKGLRAANEVGLTHGDIKPANILFEDHHKAKIADFGLARYMQQGTAAEIWGTPLYIAPEKLRKEKEDQRSDIYSLGATLFHALAGKPPFDGPTATAVAVARLDNPPPDVRDMNPAVSPEVAAVIARMLKASPHERYPTYASLLADMESVLEGLKKKRAVKPSRPKAEKSPVGWIVGAAVLIMLIAGIWAGLRQQTPPPAETPLAPSAEADATRKKSGAEPFEGVRGTAMDRILKLFAAGNVMAASESLQTLYDKIPAGDPDRAWLRLYQALILWYDGADGSASAYIDEILSAPEGDESNPLMGLARYMKGSIADADLDALAEGRPQWVKDLSGFVIGLNRARQGRKDDAAARWQQYLQTSNAEPLWVYTLKPLAQKFTESHARWKNLDGDVSALLEARKPGEARALLHDFKLTAGPVFAAEADAMMARVEEAEASLTEAETARIAEEQAAAAARMKEKADAEIARVRKTVEAGKKYYPAKDFEKALVSLEKLKPSLSMEEGWVEYQIAHEKAARLAAMHRYLEQALRTRPCRISVFGQGSKITGVASSGVRISLGPGANMIRTWPEISPAQYLGILRQYLEAEQKTAAERADDTLSMAVYAEAADGGQLAQQLAQKAATIDPQIRELGARLLPGLKWE
ncbi:MAG: serine/threonine-protein kinase [Kiritimatiellia bacterium]